MTNEEAKKQVLAYVYANTQDIPLQVIQALDVFREANEKQIPKKPIIKDGHCYCPNKCSSVTKDTLYWTVGRGENYCDRCGQAIDWIGKEQTDD